MKNKMLDLIVDVLLLAAVIWFTDIALMNIHQSENMWLKLGLYVLLCAVAFGLKRVVVILWNRTASKK